MAPVITRLAYPERYSAPATSVLCQYLCHPTLFTAHLAITDLYLIRHAILVIA